MNWTKGCDMGFTVSDTVYIANTPYTVEYVSKANGDTFPVRLRCNISDCTHYVMIDGRLADYDEIPSVTFKPQPMPDMGKPEWQPKPGELCWVWDDGYMAPSLAHFDHVDRNRFFATIDKRDGSLIWNHIAPFNGGKLPDEFKHLEGGSE